MRQFFDPIKNLDVTFLFTFLFCFSDFAWKIVKQRNFLNVVDLSFDENFGKYYHLAYISINQCLVNNIKWKCSKFDQKVCDIWQIERAVHHPGHVTLNFGNRSKFHKRTSFTSLWHNNLYIAKNDILEFKIVKNGTFWNMSSNGDVLAFLTTKFQT